MGKPQRSKYSPPARKKAGRASLVSFISFYLLGWNKTIQPPSQVPGKGMLICSPLHEEVERRRTKEKH